MGKVIHKSYPQNGKLAMNDIIKWLVIRPGETVDLRVHLSSLERVIKHFDPKVSLFYLCHGQTCDLCMEGIPKRLRYQVLVRFDGLCRRWEFGKEIYRLLKKLAGDDHAVDVVVIRQGSGRRTRYWIYPTVEAIFKTAIETSTSEVDVDTW
jgi:hypothetical protein